MPFLALHKKKLTRRPAHLDNEGILHYMQGPWLMKDFLLLYLSSYHPRYNLHTRRHESPAEVWPETQTHAQTEVQYKYSYSRETQGPAVHGAFDPDATLEIPP